MASNRYEVISIVLVVVMGTLSGGAMATTKECSSAVISLSPCVNYVSGNVSAPSHPCCAQLANVVKSHLSCLCSLVHGEMPQGYKVNETLVLGLPVACDIQTPPASGKGAKTKPQVPPPTAAASSDETRIMWPFYFNIVLLLLASNLYG
ncbi:plant lipid transfer protein/Par allergen [Artemisia annua]|uniref:Plant lipid transfer protein/Par allergen n=1 Tax=Artemisia annua TaxID=35608 RepID=A0A2U1QAN7_ARTAN|nr:plant lipid transfer protein/Par allergen [Artemisia annua]